MNQQTFSDALKVRFGLTTIDCRILLKGNDLEIICSNSEQVKAALKLYSPTAAAAYRMDIANIFLKVEGAKEHKYTYPSDIFLINFPRVIYPPNWHNS